MNDVARAAGVSTTTVSHVLNGTRAVAEPTRQRVLDVIDELGYTHNTIARSLATSSTLTIGVAISAITNPYFMDLVRALEAEISAAGYLLLLADTKEDPVEELRVIRSLHARRVDGYILAPTAHSEPSLRYLLDRGLPAVLIDRLADTHFDQVGVENRDATVQLVEHLAGLGHQHIAMVCGQEGLTTTDERVAGYRIGLENAGLRYDPALVIAGSSDIEPAREAVHRLRALPDPPTALVTANNRMTIGAMAALHDLGLTVPDDVALVCFDDFEWADLFHPRLTVVAQPISQIGEQAARMLLSRLKEPDRQPRTVQLAPTFVHRESCGCLPS